MNFKNLITITALIGFILILINLFFNQSNSCPPREIIYRYIPKTFEDEQNEPVYPSDIFKNMFTQQSPWIRSVEASDVRRSEAINKYFISQY